MKRTLASLVGIGGEGVTDRNKRRRWIAPWKNSTTKPEIYHTCGRVVGRGFLLGEEERERGEFELPPVDEAGVPLTRVEELEMARREAAGRVEEIRKRYTRRMRDLSWFMKSLLERFTKWFNSKHSRSGTLWEDRFKSVIVESGVAARTMAAYIDLNRVRAGMVSDPADYRWSGYGEAVGGGAKGNGKKSREGIVRACMDHRGAGFEAENWKEVSRIYRRAMGLALGRKGRKGGGRGALEYA